MGYSTEFNGGFDITFNDESKKEEVIELVNGLADSRRMKRDMFKADFPLKLEPADYGIEGEFYTDGDGFKGQGDDITILENNYPPSTQPSLWMQWVIEEYNDTCTLQWDGQEKFYEYVAWLEYLIEKIFKPNDVTIEGSVEYRGEDWDDNGTIRIQNNEIRES